MNRNSIVLIAKQYDGMFDDFTIEPVPVAYITPLPGDDWCLIPDAVVIDGPFANDAEAEWWAAEGSYQIEGETIGAKP